MPSFVESSNRARRSYRVVRAVITMIFIAASPTLAHAQAEAREVGTVVAGGNVFWVRATGSGQVELFMSPGYRDAFARPVPLDASRLAAWTDSARALERPASDGARVEARSGPALDSSLVFDRWLEADSAGLRVQHAGTTVRMTDTPARQLVSLLSEAAHLTEQLSAPAQHAEQVAQSAAPHQSVTPAKPAPPIEDTAPALPIRVPTLHASLDRALPRAPHLAPADTLLNARHSPVPVQTVAAKQLPQATLADKHMETPLGPFIVPGALLTNRDAQIDYCYRELGLRYDRRLTGDVTIRVTVSTTGAPDTVEVTKRTWDGVPAAEVESCMRSLIEDWTFSPAAQDRVVELHFSLAPGVKAVAQAPSEPAPAANP